MRTAPAPTISAHRLARLTAWAKLWLVWFAAKFVYHFCLGTPPRSWRRSARQQLDLVAAMVAKLIFLHAARRMPPPMQRGVHRHGRFKRSGNVRACIGSSLRHAMRGADLFSRLLAILAVMRDAEFHIAKLVRRLRLGLTRRRVLLPAPGPAFSLHPLLSAPECLLAGVDTS